MFYTALPVVVTLSVVALCIDDCMVHMSMLCSEIMNGIQKLQVGQVGLREGQEVIMVGQESHHMQQRLQSLWQREMVCLLAVKLLARINSLRMRDPIYPGRRNTGTSGSPERDSGWTGRGCPGTAEQ